jgi:hypothetical protein
MAVVLVLSNRDPESRALLQRWQELPRALHKGSVRSQPSVTAACNISCTDLLALLHRDASLGFPAMRATEQ